MHHREARQRRSRHFRGQATCILDADGHFLNVSPSLAAFFECDGNALRGQSLLACMDEEEAGQVAGRLVAVAMRHEAAHFQVRLRSPSGASWVAMQVMPGTNETLIASFTSPAM